MSSDNDAVETAGGRRVTRRRFVGASAAVATAGLAGCSSILGGGGGSPDGAVRNFYQAIEEGDTDAANDYVHPDGKLGEISQQQTEQSNEINLTLESAETVERDGDHAAVNVTVSFVVQGDESTQSGGIELRKDDGRWKIWDSSS